MECKGALKMRWTTIEVAMLTEEWASVCTTPGYKVLRGDDLNQAIFERYNKRCARSRHMRRSPLAVATQRDRMIRFAQFVADFDRAELAKGRRVWFDLSYEEQLQFDIPNEWRRQLATFTLETLNTFKRSILPAESAQGDRSKRKKSRALAVKSHKKVDAQSSAKRRKVRTYVEPQPCWTTVEKVHLVKRCAKFIKHKGFTLEGPKEMTYEKSLKCLASSKRSSFSSWRKLRTLLSSWRFIRSFNVKHQPGWFELTETERDLQIAWGDLPDNFEDIEGEVFATMEDLAPKGVQGVKEERDSPVPPPGPPSPKAISPLMPAPLGPIPLLTDLCPKDVNSESTETDETIERLLLEDDEADNFAASSEMQESDIYVIEPLGGCNFAPEAPVVKHEAVPDQPLEPAPIYPTKGAIETLEVMVQTQKAQIQVDLGQLRTTFEQRHEDLLESIGAIRAEQVLSTNAVGLLKHTQLVLEQQNKRLLSVLRLAEETYSQNDAEMESLVQTCLGKG